MASDSPFKSRGGFARIAAAGRNSLAGLRAAWRDEAAFRQELALVGVLAVLLIVELLNSALEAVVDRVGLERNALSKQAKDLGSAAVLIALLLVGATWATVLWPLARQALGVGSAAG